MSATSFYRMPATKMHSVVVATVSSALARTIISNFLSVTGCEILFRLFCLTGRDI